MTLRPAHAPRSDAVRCALAGIAAADPAPLVRAALAAGALDRERVTLVAAGKAADRMTAAAVEALGPAVRAGLVVGPAPAHTAVPPFGPHFVRLAAGHPTPTAGSARAAAAVIALADALGPDDVLLVLLSGGASALLTLPPPPVGIGEVAAVTRLLLDAGADIAALNCVRKHLDSLKGGRLAARAWPAHVVTLVLSDVTGNALDVVGSGPTVPDPTTTADARSVLQRCGAWDAAPAAVRDHLATDAAETPKPGDPRLGRSAAHVIGDMWHAAQGAAAAARDLGYDTRVVAAPLSGEARDTGARIAREALALASRGPAALVYAGETTVTVTGNGRGGRSQELALAAAIVLDGHSGVAVAAVGTDGIDGPTDAAGAVADGTTLERARALGLDAAAALRRNDSHSFWHATGDLVVTGPTGTNVADLVVVTVHPSAETATA